MVGGRGLDQGRSRGRAHARAVDDPRRHRDRSARRRHRALLPAPAHAGRRAGARGGGVQQDLRHRPPARAVGVGAAAARVPVPCPGDGAGRGVLRGRGMGTSAVVRRERGVAGGVRRPGAAARTRVGRPLVVADHRGRASRDARARRDDRPVGVRAVRHRRAGCARLPATPRRRPGRPARRGPDLHARADARRRVPQRPHDRAARAAALPRDHGCGRRGAGRVLVHASSAGGRFRGVHRRHVGRVHARVVGAARPRRAHHGDRRRRVGRRVAVRAGEASHRGHCGRARGARVVRR